MKERVSEANALSARLIGAIFLERGLVTEEQLQAALEMQKQSKEHLGEILVQHFGVSRIELASVLAEQWAELERTGAAPSHGTQQPEPGAALAIVPPPQEAGSHAPEPEQPPEQDEGEALPPGERRPLGEIFVEQGLVTDDELDRALQAQRETGEKLGEILVAQGSITRLQLASALAEQWTALRKIRPPSSPEPVNQMPVADAARDSGSEDVDRLREAVAALEQRLRAAESVAAREPWREEIGAATQGLQQTIAGLESRLDAADQGDEPADLTAVHAALEELAARVEGVASSERVAEADLLRRVESAADAAEAARSGLGGAFESLSLRLSDVEARVHDRSDLTELRADVEALSAQVSELGTAAEDPKLDSLRDEVQRVLDEVKRRAEAPAPTADPALGGRVDALAARVDELAGTVKGEKSGKASSGEVKALKESLTALGARVEELANESTLGLRDLQQTVAEMQARPAESDLAERLSHYGSGAAQIDELKERMADLEARTSELQALRAAVDELAARPAYDPALAERVEQLAVALEGNAASRTELESLRSEVEALAGAAEAASDVRRRFEELAEESWAPAEDVADLRTELRAELGALGSRVDAFARQAAEAATYEQVEEVAARLRALEEAPTRDEVAELARRVTELGALASSPSDDVARLSAEVAAHERRLEAFTERASEGVSAERFEDLSSRVGADLDRLRRTLDELNDRPAADVELVEALARRVEEIASSTGTIDQLRHDLTALAERVAGPSPELSELRARMVGMERSLQALAMQSERAVPADRVAELAAKLASLEESIHAATTGEQQLDEVRRELQSLAAQASVPFEAIAGVREEVGALAARLEALSERSAEPIPRAQLDDVGARLAAVEERVRAATSNEQLMELRREVDSLAAQVSDPRAENAVVHAEMSALAARLDMLAERPSEPISNDRLEELQRQLETLSAQVAGPHDEITAVRADVSALAASVEALADRTSEPIGAEQLDGLRQELEALSAQVAGPHEEIAGLRADVAALADAVQTGKKTRKELEALRRDLDELGSRPEPPVEDLSPLRTEVSALAERVDELRERSAGERELGGHVEQLAAELAAMAQAVDEIRGEAANAVDTSLEPLRAELGRLEERLAAIQELASSAPADEHGPRLDSLEQRLADDESTAGALGARIDDAVVGFRALEDRVSELAASAGERQDEVLRRLDETVAALRDELAAQRDEDSERTGHAERETAALQDQLARLGEALEAQTESRAGAEAELAARVDALAGLLAEKSRSGDDLAAAVGELRAELSTLGGRLDESSAATGDVLRALRSEVAEVSSLVSSTAAKPEPADDLRVRIEELERRLETPEEPEPAAEVTEARIEERAESMDAEPAVAYEPEGAYLAFVPNGQGYSLQELVGPLPAVGEPAAIANGEGELVVTRIGRSPLPLDRRQCAYLELAVAVNPPDRVT